MGPPRRNGFRGGLKRGCAGEGRQHGPASHLSHHGLPALTRASTSSTSRRYCSSSSGGGRLEAQHQHRLGVGGAHQAPAVGEEHAHAVDVDHRSALAGQCPRTLVAPPRTSSRRGSRRGSPACVTVLGSSAELRRQRPGRRRRRSRAAGRRRRWRRRSRSSGRRRRCGRSSRRPARRLLSFILALISEWPVFHMMRVAAVRARCRRTGLCEHFTSPMNVAPGLSRQDLAGEEDHQLVAPDDRSRSRRPRRCGRRRRRRRCPARRRLLAHGLPSGATRFFRHRRVGVVVGEAAVHLEEQLGRRRTSRRSQNAGASRARRSPLPASTTTLTRRAKAGSAQRRPRRRPVTTSAVFGARRRPAKSPGLDDAAAVPGSRRRGWSTCRA